MDNTPGSGATEDALPHDPSVTTRRRLVRRTEGRVIGGVAGGLADHLGVDPAIFRIAFIALALTGGFGILVYLIAWLVLPEATDTDGFMERTFRHIKSSRLVPFALIGFALIILLDALDSNGAPLMWALALIAVGAVLLRDDPIFTRLQGHGTQEPTAAAATTVATTTAPVAPGTVVTEPVPAVPVVRQPRSPLTLYTLGGTMIVLAIAAGLSAADVIDMDVGRYLGLTIACFGVGIIISAWWGRSGWLKLLGLALVPFLLGASVVNVPVKGSWGGTYVQALEDDPSGKYETMFGSTTFDMARYEFGDEPVRIEADLVAGSVSAYIPPGVTVHLDASLDYGRIATWENVTGGSDVTTEGTFRVAGSSTGEVFLTIRGGVGNVDLLSADWVEEEMQHERALQELQERKQRETDAARERKERERARG